MSMTTVRDSMTPQPTCATPAMPIREAASTMAAQDVGSLPVIAGDRLVGVITDRDIVTRVVAEGRDLERTTVGDVASADPVSVSPDERLDDALELMARHRIRRLPVVEGTLVVGVLAQADVAREGQDEATGAMVEEISTPTA